MAIVIQSVTPDWVPMKGGTVVTVVVGAGQLTPGTNYRLYAGPNGDDTDEPCYSGVIGQGLDCLPEDAQTIECVVPDIPRGRHYISIYGAGGNDAESITAREVSFLDTSFDVRSTFPHWYHTGPRRLADEPRQDT